jgi:ATP-dependent helicase YprA (DUF1998 family)
MQAGRAGRSGRPCVSVLVGLAGALDQYWMQHPDELFGSQPEDVTIDQANPCILALQMVAAASELPLTEEDAAGLRYQYPTSDPAHRLGLYSASSAEILSLILARYGNCS